VTDIESAPRQKPLFHPWWSLGMVLTLAIAGFYAYVLEALASITWCGVFGCAYGGGQLIHQPEAFIYAGFAAVVVAAPLFAYPWTRLKTLRFGLATAVLAVLVWICFTHLFALG
jgi:ABC-type branched-subunit amino acid transport system permease subunit